MSEYIKIGNKQLLVSLEWEEKEGKSKRQILAEIKKEAKESTNRFGYVSEFKKSEESGSNKGTCQYLLFPYAKNDVVLGSAIISDLFKDSIFVKKIDTDNIDEVQYWVCAVDNEGLVYDEGDRLITDEDELELFIEDMISLYEMKVVGFSEDFSFLDIDLDVELEDEFLDTYLDSQSYKIKEIVKERSVTQKNITRAALGVTGTIGLFLAFYENDMYQEFENDMFLDMLPSMEKELKKYKKINKVSRNKKVYSHNDYINLGKKNFSDYYNSTFFDNKEVIGNLLYLDNILNPFEMEWEFSKMIFKNNEFLIMYNKIPKSIGVYVDLDTRIKEVSEQNNTFNMIPVALVNSGETRVYKVSFGENQKEKLFMARKLAKANEKTKKYIIEELEKDAVKMKNEVYSISENIKELNILEQIFSDDVEISYDQVEMMIRDLKEVYKSINEEINRYVPPVEISEDKINGSDLRYIEISQRDNLFNWSYPAKGNFFPSDNLVSKKDSKHLKSFAKSHLVEMSSLEDVSEGVMYMEEALFLIDKPYIQIKQVEVLVSKQQWGITSEVYEQVGDLISKEEDKKTIKQNSKKKKRKKNK